MSKEYGEVRCFKRFYYRQSDTDLMQTYTDIKAKVYKSGSKPHCILVTDFKEVSELDNTKMIY